MHIAIDTSTDNASLALVRESEIIAELTWHSEQNHSVQLLPNLSHLLNQGKLSLSSVSGIIVAKGPGGYNGLRVGLSTAKGLAFCLNVPIVGISTLEVEAYQHAGMGLPVCPIFNAGRGEIATAIYERKKDKWSQSMVEQITTIDTLCSQIAARTVFCGQITPAVATSLRETLGEKAVIISSAVDWRRAGFLAELGLKHFNSGDYDDLVTLQPLYLRGPAITQAKHR